MNLSAVQKERMGAAPQRPLRDFPTTLHFEYRRKGQTQKGQEAQMAMVTEKDTATGAVVHMWIEVHVAGYAYAYAETVGEAARAWKLAMDETALIMGPLY